ATAMALRASSTSLRWPWPGEVLLAGVCNHARALPRSRCAGWPGEVLLAGVCNKMRWHNGWHHSCGLGKCFSLEFATIFHHLDRKNEIRWPGEVLLAGVCNRR